MKILEVTNVDFSLYQFLLPLMRGLKAQRHEVIGVCAEGDLLTKVRQEGFDIQTVPFIRSYAPVAQIKALWAIYKIIKQEKPDIVHAHMPISGFLTRLAAFFCGTPIIAYTCHGYLFNQAGQGVKSWIRRGLSFALEWSAGQITDLYMTVSAEEAKDAKKLRIHSQPVYIGNGRDPVKFAPNPIIRSAIRKEIGIDDDKTVFLIVSRLVRHKGYPELLAAFMALAARNKNIELWIVGERLSSDHGHALDRAFDTAKEKLGDQLRLWGYRDDINQLMKAADVFVLPSHFEGLPMSIVEAMLSELPVISTAIRGPREQVEHKKTGLLVPAGSVQELAKAMAWMIEYPKERQAMGRLGRQRGVACFTEEQQLQKAMQLLLSH
ncbi:Glycosyltransferase involved in cell wall bisynthesis (RfaB) (PDB:2IV7) [Commensalibacter communis]|uniref:glycosyltransferase family 4 protein n=1 Tax=Commensalibacter communis TaxID=2972786 RepID=UPI0022FF6357|nr:glycosyltransferase family 4 protein [Commensalibacter communis]CAI3959410.1 Glycosyltransferase involved in cell wall bisynthesis (RfaB) (PDB:2IV7) [Commensalibacter communis]CAI3960301.1 Glycosyltransferase involved in cell wall bisynthesis (RfaB) (PDB:2IV7) [Commensalibacter communis]